MSRQEITINSTTSSLSDAEMSTIQSTRCILADKTSLYQAANIPNKDMFNAIFDPFKMNLSEESSMKSGVAVELPSLSRAPQIVSFKGADEQVTSDSQSLSNLMKIHCNINPREKIKCLENFMESWTIASVECNKGICYRYPLEGNSETENDRENINPCRTSDAVMDTKIQLKRLERKIAGKARLGDCISESDGTQIYEDYRIPSKRAALNLKLTRREPAETTLSSVNIEIISSLLSFLQNPTGSNAAFQVLQKLLHKNVGRSLPIVLTNKLDSTSQISCQIIPRLLNIGKCETSLTRTVGSSQQMTTPMAKEFDIKWKYSNELMERHIQIPISTIIQLLSGTGITVSKSNSRGENLELESESNSSQIEGRSCSINVRKDNCQVATMPKGNQCFCGKLTKIPVEVKSDKFNRKAIGTTARMDSNPFKIFSYCGVLFPDERKCDDAIESSASLDKKQKSDVDFPSRQDVQNLCSECHCPPIDGDIFLCCSKCNTEAHSSCFRYSPELSEIFKDDPWQCLKCEGKFTSPHLLYNENMYICDLCGKRDFSLFRSPECEILKCPESYRLCTYCFLDYIQFQLEQLVEQNNETIRGNNENENSLEKSGGDVKESYL